MKARRVLPSKTHTAERAGAYLIDHLGDRAGGGKGGGVGGGGVHSSHPESLSKLFSPLPTMVHASMDSFFGYMVGSDGMVLRMI